MKTRYLKIKKNLFFCIILKVVRSLQLRTLIIIFSLCFISNILNAQYWHYYNPTLLFDVNTVEILGPGAIVTGGGKETNDSTQIMLETIDYGVTWNENIHDGYAPWNKSIAFSDALNGFGVGNDGRIIRTDDGGKNWGNPVTPINRNLNKIIYIGDNIYFVVGGSKSNDSTQIILKSSDNGITWNVIYDDLGPWLKSILFINTQKGFAVGDNGVILTTSDGGNSWTTISAPVQRDFNALTFINPDTGYIVGGTSTGMSHRTILRTVNGGADWSVFIDTIGGILKDISFADALIGYTVGDSATVLKTTDGGLSWLPILIDTNIAGNESFNAVKFSNQNFGVIGGKAGIIYVYHNPFPIVVTSIASDINFNTARLNGSINAGGIPTSVKFEYGTTTAYGNDIVAIPDSSSVIDSITVYALLTGLMPNSTYHYRIKGTSGFVTNYGKDFQFYTGQPEIPNFDFENWDTTTIDFPDEWTKAGGIISKYSPGCSGSYAVKIQNTPDGDFYGRGILMMGFVGDAIFGGVPFNVRPDSLMGCFNYNIEQNDTALIVVFLKKNGNLIVNDMFLIHGNSNEDFVNLSFPIHYQTSDIPDSIIIAFACSDMRYFNNHPLTSYLIADNIRFSGTSLTIPNNSFEQWHFEHRMNLLNWKYNGFGLVPPDTLGTTSVTRVTDAVTNKFALKLKAYHQPHDIASGQLKSGNRFTDKIPLNSSHQTLTGYYKYFPQNNDTMSIDIFMSMNGVTIGRGTFLKNDTISIFKPFIANIIYFTPSLIPDSASIVIQASKGPSHGNSALYIDNLNFDGFLSGIKEPVLTIAGYFDFNVYPNPFNEQATVSFTINKDENVVVRLLDLSGKQVALLANGKYSAGDHKLNLSAEGLPKGFYICIINTENRNYFKKIIIQ